MSKHLPYYKMFPADAQSDEKWLAMSYADLGFFITMLNFAWSNGASLPRDLSALARMLHTTLLIVNRRWVRVGPCWIPHPTDNARMVNPRQFADWNETLEEADGRVAAGRKGGLASAKARAGKSTIASTVVERSLNDSLTIAQPRAYESDSGSEYKKNLELNLESAKIHIEPRKRGLDGWVFDAEAAWFAFLALYPKKGQTMLTDAKVKYIDFLIDCGVNAPAEQAAVMEHMRDRWEASDKWDKGFVKNISDFIKNRSWNEFPEVKQAPKLSLIDEMLAEERAKDG